MSPARRRRRAPAWRLVEHTADLAVAVRGSTLTRLFDAAAAALLALGAGDPARIRTRRTIVIRVHGATPEDLLVRWLQELLYLQETRGLRFAVARVRALDRRRLILRGVARGEALDAARPAGGREIKAVTYHGLKIRRSAGMLRARVVLDV